MEPTPNRRKVESITSFVSKTIVETLIPNWGPHMQSIGYWNCDWGGIEFPSGGGLNFDKVITNSVMTFILFLSVKVRRNERLK